ncbi:unnamed protein product, partial [Cladocopium goreaui]
VRKDQLLKFADDVTQRMADWQHKKEAEIRQMVSTWKSARFKFVPKGDSLTAEAAQMEELRQMLRELQGLRQRGDMEDWSNIESTDEGPGADDRLQEEISLEELRWDWMQSETSMQELQGLLRLAQNAFREKRSMGG